MLHWRLLIGIPLVALMIGLCWLDAISPAPGLALMPFFLVCVFFLCKEILHLLNAGGIFPRRTTIYLGVFGTIILCWISCYNSLPIVLKLERSIASALQIDERTTIPNIHDDLDQEGRKAIDGAAQAVELAQDALDQARRALELAQTNDRIISDLPTQSVNETASLLNSSTGLSNEYEWRTAAFACVHILLAIAAGVLIAFVGEMLRFKLPGGHMINLSGAVFAIVYIGLLGSFMVLLRIAYGITAVVSLILVTKMCDIGAYTIGRLFGRHKMAPSLSPGKTIEGGIGGLSFAILGAWFSTAFLFPLATHQPSQTTWLGIIIYGVTVGLAGALGDLAESLIKRDVMRKDSGTRVPGFGGFLDIFDSLLLAAPVAFGLWAFHVIQ